MVILPLLSSGGRGNHVTLMSVGVVLDRDSWGAVLGTERRKRQETNKPCHGKEAGAEPVWPGGTCLDWTDLVDPGTCSSVPSATLRSPLV